MGRPLPSLPSPNPQILNKLLFPNNRHIRSKALELVKEPVFQVHYGETIGMERERTHARFRRLRQAGFLQNTITEGNSNAARRYDALVEVLALVDHSIEVFLGVNFGLFSTTLRRIGSKQQWDYWLPRIERGDDIGCFALTELGHGSNVRGIETVARYDISRREFEIHTPVESAQKYWIGGAAQYANLAVVFSQLYIGEVGYGIHVFLVPLRNQQGELMEGVEIADCGHKAGLNGVDNGRIWFTKVRVPRENMLNGMSDVAADGSYSSNYATADVRFGAQLAALTGGRVSIAVVGVQIAMQGLTIAIRYSLSRRAFSKKVGEEEVPLLYFRSHQRLLMVPLATSYVYMFCGRDLQEMFYDAMDSGTASKQVHTLSSGFKALFTWFMQDTLQKARECCGGQGYKSENRISVLKADRDVMLTFEGANGVMLQQVAKVLLGEGLVAQKNGGKFSKASIAEALNHVPKSRGSSKKLDREFIYGAFWRREKKLVELLLSQYAEQLRRYKGSSFDAWNECLSIAEAAVVANMHRRIYEAHERHLQNAFQAEVGCGEAVKLCGEVWAAEMICGDVGFLRMRCISVEEARDVDAAMNGLCGRMTKIAERLLEGIGIPDHLLAPIAGDYVAHNSRARL